MGPGSDCVEFIETPVLPSLLTRLIQGFINGKMRGGEPKALWPRIAPMYKDGVIRAFSAEPFDDALAATVVEEYAKLK